VFVQRLCDLAQERRASLRAAAALFVRKVPCLVWSCTNGDRKLSISGFGASCTACCAWLSWVPAEKPQIEKAGDGEVLKEDMFVDRAVYTRNRAFRLYLSSKAGKQATLQPTSDYPRFALITYVSCSAPSCNT